MDRLQSDSADDHRSTSPAPPAVDGAAPAQPVAPAAPGAEIDPAKLPAPVGDENHPSLVLRHDFFHFRDEFQLRKEPSVEESVAAYLPEVEKAFENRWNLHPNVILERTHAEKIKHAYDLDFRENEINRIRSILPVDKDVFDYVDVLIDVIMLKNLRIYVAKRKAAFLTSVWLTRAVFLVLLIVGVALSGPVFGELRKLIGTAGQTELLSVGKATLLDLNGLLLAVIANPIPLLSAVGLSIALAFAVWYVVITLRLGNVKEHYEAGVRDATGLAALKLANKGRDVNDLMNFLKNSLETINIPTKERADAAPKLVRILLWCPERMLLIENYYRAKMDQFNVKSAMVSLRSLVNTRGIIYNRSILLFVLGVILGAGFYYAGAFASGNQVAPTPTAQVTEIAPSSPDYADAAQAPASAPIAQPTPATDTKPDPLLSKLIGILGLVVVASFFVCTTLLNRLGGSFALGEIRDEQNELLRNGLLFFLIAVVLGLALLAAIFVYRDDFSVAQIANAAIVLYAFLAVWFLIPAVLARLLFQTYEHIYSSNVLSAVIKKMDSSQWTRYSDLRVDQRVSEVFTAIYGAWLRESSKGIYGGGTHAAAPAPERRHFKTDNT